MTKPLKVAAVQYFLTGGLSVAEYLEKFEGLVRSAVGNGAELVVFPELCSADLFGPKAGVADGTVADERKHILRLARTETPLIRQRAIDLSKELKVAILAGTMPRESESGSGKIHNTAILTFPNGAEILQDKLFLTACEKKDWEWTPGDRLKVFNAPWGKTAILICYDSEIPKISSLLVHVKPELLLIPSCTGTPQGFYRVRWAAQARAVEHFAYVLHTGTVGPGPATPNMNSHHGQASLITPSEPGFAGVLAEGVVNQDQIVYGDLDFEQLRRGRQVARVYPARDEILRANELDLSIDEC